MYRLTARFLLCFALAGVFAPLAQALTAPPPHACCRRMSHRCQDSAAAESGQPAVHGTGCCNHDCCRAVTTSQWASPQPWATAAFAGRKAGSVGELHATIPANQLPSSQSTRAPPPISLA